MAPRLKNFPRFSDAKCFPVRAFVELRHITYMYNIHVQQFCWVGTEIFRSLQRGVYVTLTHPQVLFYGTGTYISKHRPPLFIYLAVFRYSCNTRQRNTFYMSTPVST